MATWGELLKELADLNRRLKDPSDPFSLPEGVSVFDYVRRRALNDLATHTGRNVILYASDWLGGADPQATQVDMGDIQGFMEVIHGLSGGDLDLILHLPGGSAEAAEAVVNYLRKKFSSVRAFVPHAAMSAATMLACSADEIVMGAHSSLGPIDPQMVLRNQEGVQVVPAQAVLDQFRRAQQESAANPKLLASWVPMLRGYGPGLLVQCEHHQKLAEELVGTWLSKYMFAGQSDAEAQGKDIARKLAAHKTFLSHARPISADAARTLGLRVTDLEGDQNLQDKVLTVYHAAMHTFSATGTAKIVENQLGKCVIRSMQQLRLPMGLPVAPAQRPRPPASPPPPAAPPRTGGGSNNRGRDRKRRGKNR